MRTTVSKPVINERPAIYADRLGIEYSYAVTHEHKKKLGQFFTPISVANFMSEFADGIRTNKIKLLDPGCGTGVLACAVIERLVQLNSSLEEVDLVAFESDVELLVFTDAVFEYLHKWLSQKKIKFRFFLCKNDFILHNSSILSNNVDPLEKYNIVITNPPYFKIKKEDKRAEAARSVIYGQTNIYSIFLLIAARLLDEGGILIFITPRSFSSGNYFKLFREKFFELLEITNIHLFVSRRETFERDKVLQENIVVSAKKKREVFQNQLELLFSRTILPNIEISTSNSINDIENRIINEYQFSDLVNLKSEQKIIHIPISDNDRKAIRLFKTWAFTLVDFGMRISTGPVVDFRSTDFIRNVQEKNTVPLIYLHNVDKMIFKWPSDRKAKGKHKGEYLIYNSHSFSRLVLNRNYILLRRFSSKEDSSRLVASPYFAEWLRQFSMLGIENHLNYIYRKDGDLHKSEVVGLAGLLNSKLFDVYFRTFNGNINVSATELRNLPLPSLQEIKKIGEQILKKSSGCDQNFIDQIVQDKFAIDLR